MAKLKGIVVSFSELSEAKRLLKIRGKVLLLIKRLFSEIENLTGRELPGLGVCLHDRISGQLCSPLPHLPAWKSENVIHVLADVDWWKKESLRLLKEKPIAKIQSAMTIFEEYYSGWNLEFLVYLLCGHEACHYLTLFPEDDKYYSIAPRWIEEGLCFYISYELIKKRKRKMSELALKTDQIVFEALKQPLSKREHWLYEFYDHKKKYSKAGAKYKKLIDLWDYSTATLAVNELSVKSRKSLKEIMDAASSSYEKVTESTDRVYANLEFLKFLFDELSPKTTIKRFCSKFRICPAHN
ncbi:MAG: hypothetical protein QXX08_09625 [Candidatus Bathyarchaeia archaeon]